jgi:hypothetical protein
MIDLTLKPGPTAYKSILLSPHKTEIDRRLFTQRWPVLKVMTWLTDDLHVSDITYATLNRYKNSRNALTTADSSDIRRKEVKRDLKFLSEVVKRGATDMRAGVAVRPSEAMKAIELRSHLLASFPDVSEEREDALIAMNRLLLEAVVAVCSEEQRIAIYRLIQPDQLPQERAE